MGPCVFAGCHSLKSDWEYELRSTRRGPFFKMSSQSVHVLWNNYLHRRGPLMTHDSSRVTIPYIDALGLEEGDPSQK